MSHTFQITFIFHGAPRQIYISALNIHEALEKFTLVNGAAFITNVEFIIPKVG